MKSSLRMFVMFLTIFSLIYGGAHLFVWWQLVYPLKLTGWVAWIVPLVLTILFLSFPFIHFAFRHQNGWFISPANFVSVVWMGMIVYLVLVTVGYDLLRLVSWGAIPGGRAMTATVTGIAAAITVYGLIEARSIGVTNLTVPMVNLPAQLEGMRIVQLSDVHMGLIVRGSRLEKIVTMVNDLHPDLVVITGDLVDAEPSHMEDMIPALRRLQSKYGIFAVTGNHEFFAGVERAQGLIERAGVTMLRNRWVTVNGGLQLIGRDDPVAARITGKPVPSLDEIMQGIDHAKPAILLYHTPSTTLAELESHGIGLQLSGHTHQGQLWPFNFLVKRLFKTPYGLFTDGKATIYVSRGTGTWGPPMRVLAPPEITLVTLTSKS
jgi:predicted MPP superfamily phosphohydrolase